jgi:hypothetical protein
MRSCADCGSAVVAEDRSEKEGLTLACMHAVGVERSPRKLELGRARRELGILGGFCAEWQAQPKRQAPGPPPSGPISPWIRDHRSLQDFGKTIVAGRLYLTRMERGLVTIVELLEFDDHGDELLKLVDWTQHPTAQARPCHCDSGKGSPDCHPADWYADGHPCDCGSGKPFGRVLHEVTDNRLGRCRLPCDAPCLQCLDEFPRLVREADSSGRVRIPGVNSTTTAAGVLVVHWVLLTVVDPPQSRVTRARSRRAIAPTDLGS